MLKKCSNSQKFSSKSIYSALRHQKGAVAPLNPWMVPLLSVGEVKACFSLVNWHLIQGRKEVTLPCCCEGLTPAFKLLPTVSYSFRQALWNDVSYSCGLKGFAYFLLHCETCRTFWVSFFYCWVNRTTKSRNLLCRHHFVLLFLWFYNSKSVYFEDPCVFLSNRNCNFLERKCVCGFKNESNARTFSISFHRKLAFFLTHHIV